MTRVGVSDSIGGHDPLHARKSFQQRGDGESKSMYLSIREEVHNLIYHIVDQKLDPIRSSHSVGWGSRGVQGKGICGIGVVIFGIGLPLTLWVRGDDSWD